MSLPGKTIAINGINYHVSDQGDAERCVLLLHGMPDTSSIWRPQADALLAEGFRVVAPDMLGYGLTDKPQEPERYAGERVLADLVALIEALELSALDIVGHDWGAFASWELAINFPDRFRRHVAISVGHPAAFFGALSLSALKDNWYMYLNAQDAAPDLYVLNDCAFFRNYIIPSHPDADEVCSRVRDPAAMRAMLNWDRGNPLASLYCALESGAAGFDRCRVPTLGIWSGGDHYLPEAQVTASPEYMEADWRYERLPGSHWVMLDEPQAVSDLIVEWLTQ